jgi:hypothetical protein
MNTTKLTISDYAKKEGRTVSAVYKSIQRGTLQKDNFISRKQKSCSYCGELFTPKSNFAKHCSEKCNRQNYYYNNLDKVKRKNKIKGKIIRDRKRAVKAKNAKQDIYCVYLIGFKKNDSSNFVKIGYCKDNRFKDRFTHIQTGCPEKINVFKVMKFNTHKYEVLDFEQNLRGVFEKTSANNEWVIINNHDLESISNIWQ